MSSKQRKLQVALKCKGCGQTNIAQGSGADLCLYCQSRLTHCQIGASGYKDMSISVSWCFNKDMRILNADCENCEHYSEEKILPEVGE